MLITPVAKTLTDPTLVAATVATTLNIPVAPAQPAVDAIVTDLRQRNSLLIFDNCEHLVSHAAEIVDVREDGSFRLDLDYFAFHYDLVMTNPRFAAKFIPARTAESRMPAMSPPCCWIRRTKYCWAAVVIWIMARRHPGELGPKWYRMPRGAS